MPAINPFSGELDPTPDEIMYRNVPVSRDYGAPELNQKIRAARDELPGEVGAHLFDDLIEEYGESEVAYTKDAFWNSEDLSETDVDADVVKALLAAESARLLYREGQAAAKLLKA